VNRQQLLYRLSQKGWPIVYSTGAHSLSDRAKPRWKQADWFSHFTPADGILVDCPGRLASTWERFETWDRLALRRHTQRLLASFKRLQAEPRIALLFHPRFWRYVETLKLPVVAFHCYDDFSGSPVFCGAMEQLVRRADLFTVTAPGMIRFLPAELRSKARELPNGVDSNLFFNATTSSCPEELRKIPRPRIGYAGRIGRKVDLELITEVACQRPGWQWVLIGATHFPATGGHLPIQMPPNVHLLGEKQRDAIAAFMAHMDVNTMCYNVNTKGWWVSGYPLKLHEYLAVGVPVVSADLETIRPFSDVVDIARSPVEWISAIERALKHGGVGTVEQRRAVAARNTWEQRTATLHRWLLETSDGVPR
jgi:glycosyltransferase involved in cell wall biosynthesis